MTGPGFKVQITDEDLYAAYLAADRNASALAPLLGCSTPAARKRVVGMLARMEAQPITSAATPDVVNRVAELLERSGVDINAVERIRGLRLKSYGMGIKNKDGEIETTALHSTGFTIDPILTERDNPCITQAPPIKVLYENVPRIMRKVRTVFVVSDAQIGYINGPQGPESIHDDDAIEVTKQLIAATSPDELVFIGDWIDNTAFSRWPMRPEYEGTAQLSIDTASRIMGEMVSAAGPQCGKRVCVSGNHDVRFERYALANAMAFVGIKRANSGPSEWPVLSMKFLLRFDEMGVEYLGQFPAGGYWIADNILAIHEPQKKLDYRAHIIHGHDHRLTMEAYAQHDRNGRESFFQYSVGCICKVGSRTTDPTSLLLTQTPSSQAKTSWSQGNGVLEIIDGKFTQHQFEHVHIRQGVALYRGEVFSSSLNTAA